MPNICQAEVINRINYFITNLPEEEKKHCLLSTLGACHGFSLLSIVYDDFENELAVLMAAPLHEVITPGTRAYAIAEKLATEIPILQDPQCPFTGISFFRQHQHNAFNYTKLEMFGKYIIFLNKNKLEKIFKESLGAEPCSMILSDQQHAICIKYKDNQISVYDPNSKNGSRKFKNFKKAADYISKIFIGLEEKLLQTTTVDNFNYNAAIVVVKKLSDNSPKPTALLEKLSEENNFANKSTNGALKNNEFIDSFNIDVADTAFVRSPLPGTFDLKPDKYLKTLENRKEIEMDLATVSSKSIKNVLQDPYFQQKIAESTPDYKHSIKEVIENYKDDYEEQKAASVLYLLVKRNNRKIEDIILEDFEKYDDPLLLKTLGIEYLKIAAEKSKKLSIIKLALESEINLLTETSIAQAVLGKNTSQAHNILPYIYFKGNTEQVKQYADLLMKKQVDNNLTLDEIYNILKLMDCAASDDKADFLSIFLKFFDNIPTLKFEYLLLLSIEYESKAVFELLADSLDLKILLNVRPLLSVSENGSIKFMTFLVEYLQRKGLFSEFNTQLTSTGDNSLSLAVSKGKKAHVELLLNAGATIDSMVRNMTPLYIACVKGHADIVTMLFERNPVPCIVMPNTRNLFEAAKNSPNKDLLKHLRNLFLKPYVNNENQLNKTRLFADIPQYIRNTYFSDLIDVNANSKMKSHIISPFPLKENVINHSNKRLAGEQDNLSNKKLTLADITNTQHPPPPQKNQNILASLFQP